MKKNATHVGSGRQAKSDLSLNALDGIDAAQALHFLELLGKDERAARLRAFPHKNNPNRATIGARKGDFDLEVAQQWQSEGRGIYLVINNGGDNSVSITDCVAYFAEFDGIPEDEQVNRIKRSGMPEPSATVRTSGGSLHFYWLLQRPVTTKAAWQQEMKRLAAHLRSDPAVNDPCRVMRLPGCAYVGPGGTATGRVELISATACRYTAAEITGCLPTSTEIERPKPRRYPQAPRHTLQELANALAHIPPRVAGDKTYSYYRDILWGLVAACKDLGFDEETAIALMEAHSPSRDCGWNVSQVARSGGHAFTAGTLFHHAKQHGWRPNTND